MTILEYDNIYDAIINLLSEKYEKGLLSKSEVHVIFKDAISCSKKIQDCIVEDLIAIKERDPASKNYLNPFLNYKGYHALESFRVSNWLWSQGRSDLAHLQQSQIFIRLQK